MEITCLWTGSQTGKVRQRKTERIKRTQQYAFHRLLETTCALRFLMITFCIFECLGISELCSSTEAIPQ